MRPSNPTGRPAGCRHDRRGGRLRRRPGAHLVPRRARGRCGPLRRTRRVAGAAAGGRRGRRDARPSHGQPRGGDHRRAQCRGRGDRRPRGDGRPSRCQPGRHRLRPLDDPEHLRPGPCPAKDWGPGDEVVVTRLDHDANIRPWVQAAEAVGATVRWAAFDRQSAELPTWAITDLLHERTRLVAVTGASNLLGTRPDVPAIAAAAHSVGALVHLDAVHLTPHAPIDLPSLGVDFVACSPYKFFGPHHGVLAAAPAVLEAIRPDKLLPSTDRVPERFELGTLPYELLAGTAAAVDVIADLVPGKGSRRERILASMAAAEAYEDTLWHRMVDGLDTIPGVVRYGRPERHTPTVLFSVTGVDSRAVYEHLATRGVNAPAGSFYALEASRWLGLGDDGAVRAGLTPYTDDSDVDRLLEAVAEAAARA
ncbi:MAG: cysteine desulfurase-like protein [Candidatus Nanopelagicales bacterium]